MILTKSVFVQICLCLIGFGIVLICFSITPWRNDIAYDIGINFVFVVIGILTTTFFVGYFESKRKEDLAKALMMNSFENVILDIKTEICIAFFYKLSIDKLELTNRVEFYFNKIENELDFKFKHIVMENVLVDLEGNRNTWSNIKYAEKIFSESFKKISAFQKNYIEVIPNDIFMTLESISIVLRDSSKVVTPLTRMINILGSSQKDKKVIAAIEENMSIDFKKLYQLIRELEKEWRFLGTF